MRSNLPGFIVLTLPLCLTAALACGARVTAGEPEGAAGNGDATGGAGIERPVAAGATASGGAAAGGAGQGTGGAKTAVGGGASATGGAFARGGSPATGGSSPRGGSPGFPGGSTAMGGAAPGGGMTGFGGGWGEPPAIPGLEAEIFSLCLSGCQVFAERCPPAFPNPSSGCVQVCREMVETYGPCPQLAEAFDCIAARARIGGGCDTLFVDECLPTDTFLNECDPRPPPNQGICSSVRNDGREACTFESTTCNTMHIYGVSCSVVQPGLAQCECYSSEAPGVAFEFGMPEGEFIHTHCAEQTLSNLCGYPVGF